MNKATLDVVATRSLESIRAKARKSNTVAALDALKTKPSREKYLTAEKLGWDDISLDTWDCLWLRQQALGSLS